MTKQKSKDRERVWLSIRGSFGSEDATGVPAEFMTEGDYYMDSDTPCISYSEYAMSAMGNTKTTIRIEDDSISVLRIGDVNSLMEFVPGEHNMTMYETPFGEIPIDTYTKSVNVDYDESKTPRSVTVDYDLGFGNRCDANSIKILIRPCEE